MVVLASRASAILYNFLRALDDKRPFLLPANVCPVVPLTFLKAECCFEFLDISPNNLCMDETIVLDRLNQFASQIAGLLYVHTYGALQPVAEFFRRVKAIRSDLAIIDDRCLTIPQFDVDRGLADVVLYSTGRSKYVDRGLGGYAFVNDAIPYRRYPLLFSEKALRALEIRSKTAIDTHQRFTYLDSNWLNNYPFDVPFDAFRKDVQRDTLQVRDHKCRLNDIYARHLPREIQLAPEFQNWRFQIRIPNKKNLLGRIFQAGLFASSHYAPLSGIFAKGRAPRAAELHSEVVNLFNDYHFTGEKATAVSQIVNMHLVAQ